MPGEVSEELMQHMIDEGYIVVAENQKNYPINLQEETLYEFGKVPPFSDPEARDLFFKLYHEAMDDGYSLRQEHVYRPAHRPRRRRRR